MTVLGILGLSGLVLFLLWFSGELVKENDELKQKWGVRRNKTEYDYDLVTYKNSIFIDVR